MKKATRIELYDAGIRIESTEKDSGIFNHLNQISEYELWGNDIANLAKFFKVPFESYTPIGRKTEYLRDAFFTIHGNLQVEKIEGELWAEVISSHLLDIKMVWKEEHPTRITYSGRFTIEWVNDND